MKREEVFSISEVAEALNVTEKTVRNRIKAGKILAEKIDGPNGPQWQIPRGVIEGASEVVEVLKVNKTIDIQEFGTQLFQVLRENRHQTNEQIARMEAEIEQLRKEQQEDRKIQQSAIEYLVKREKAREQGKLPDYPIDPLVEGSRKEKKRKFLWGIFSK